MAQTQADLYTNLDTTFRAIAPVAEPYLRDWIQETPPTFSTVIRDSPDEQAFLLNTAGLFKELRPGFATLKQSAPVLADAFATGTQTLPPHQGARRAAARACPSGSDATRRRRRSTAAWTGSR